MKKKRSALRLVDTTFRDANQSLLGGSLTGEEIVPVAAMMDDIGFTAMEAFGGATFETQIRRGEDPWEYVRALAKVTPNTPIQALIRGQNLVANRNFADDTVELFVKHAAKCGVDVFRVFDPLNDLRNMETAIAAVLKAKKKVQGALCYAVSPAHSIELWCSLAKGLANMGCHEVVVKDTSGLLSPQATWELVTALKQTVKIPIDVHSHCSSGMAPMAYMAGVEAGAEVVDVAMSPLAWGTSQPAAESVVAALAGGEYDTGLELDRMWKARAAVEVLKRNHLAQLSPVATIVMVWAAILLAASFSSLTVALGTLARSFRQGQAYATPLYFITIFPASIVLFIPDFNPNIAYYLIPIFNAVLLLRDAIAHNAVGWEQLAMTSVSLILTGTLSFYAALKLFTREALLVRS